MQQKQLQIYDFIKTNNPKEKKKTWDTKEWSRIKGQRTGDHQRKHTRKIKILYESQNNQKEQTH